MDDAVLQAVLVTLIQVLAPVVMGALVVLIRAAVGYLKAQMSAEQLVLVESLARQFVLAAEQNGLNGELARLGLEKKEWAILRLESELEKRGIKVDIHVLSDIIEAAVHAEFNQGKIE